MCFSNAPRARACGDLRHDWRRHAHSAGARPTAVNLSWAVKRLVNAIQGVAPEDYYERLEREALAIHDEDRAACRSIGEHGVSFQLRTLSFSHSITLSRHYGFTALHAVLRAPCWRRCGAGGVVAFGVKLDAGGIRP